MSDMTNPPQAERRPVELTTHDDVRVDEWHWLRDREDPAVIELLNAENDYTATVMRDTEELQQELFEEIKARILETDLSVPTRKGAWWYYHRTEESKQYGIHCRKADQNGEMSNEEIVLFDENVAAEGTEFFSLGTFDIDPSGNRLAYSVDTDGSETFEMRIRNLETLTDLDDVITDTYYGSAWSRDGSVLFYTRQDETKRPYQVWRHVIGTDAATDVLVFQEDDERFFIGVGNSKTEDFIVISIGSSLTSEMHFLDADTPLAEFTVIEPRVQGIEYHVSHHRGTENTFYILTNENAPNFTLMKTPVTAPGRADWTQVIAHRDNVKLDGVESFAQHLVLSERAEGNARIAVLDLKSGDYTVMQQDEPVYTASTSGNAEFDTTTLRFSYTSLVTPNTVYEQDLVTGERKMLKRQPVLGDFDPSLYTS
jgi:oligopeptidase B